MTKKKVWIIIGLIFLLWSQPTSQYMSIPELYDMAWLYGLIDTAIITFIMMFIPFICRLVNKKKLDLNIGKKLCKWNSIIMFVLSIIITGIITNFEGFMGIGGLGALAFYFINKWLFVNENEIIKEVNKNNKSKIEKNKKIIHAKKQEQKIQEKHISKKHFNIILIVIVCLILFIIIFSCIPLFKNKDTQNNTQYRARHILVLSETEANVVIYKLNHGYDFCELANEYSQDTSNSSNCGDLGYFYEGDMVLAFENAVKDLDYNEYTQKPIKTEYGYHIIMRIK